MSLLALSPRKWPRQLRLTATLTLLLLVALAAINQPLTNEVAPRGIISFELAATSADASAMVQSWNTSAMTWARLSLYLDFPFIAAYLLFLLGLSGHWLLDRPGVREQQVGHVAKVLFCTAAAADMGENVGLLVTLENTQSWFWPMAAAILALIKFSCLLGGLGLLIVLRAARGQPLATS